MINKKYICSIDKDYADELISKGFKFIEKREVDNQSIFILLPPNDKKFDKLDKNKCFFSNKRFF